MENWPTGSTARLVFFFSLRTAKICKNNSVISGQSAHAAKQYLPTFYVLPTITTVDIVAIAIIFHLC